MNLSHVTEWVKEGGDLPALSSKSHIIPKGSLKREQRRENIIITPKHFPHPQKMWEEALNIPSPAAHLGGSPLSPLIKNIFAFLPHSTDE